MTLSLVFMLLALLCFGCLGVIAKAADLRACRPSALCASLFFWAFLFVSMFLVFSSLPIRTVPWPVLSLAATFGVTAAVGGLAFQSAIRYGKISTNWLIVNLSAVIPAIASAVIYHEALDARKAVAAGMIFVSVVLLWKDKSEEEWRLRRAQAGSEKASCGGG